MLPSATRGPCPCGSGRAFASCCAPYVVDGLAPPTAEATMRSRYAAYALGVPDHLFRTWHPRTRPAEVSVPDETRWTGLDVLDVVGGGADDATGVVEFVAHWNTDVQQGVLRERSTFARRGGRWVYVDGVSS